LASCPRRKPNQTLTAQANSDRSRTTVDGNVSNHPVEGAMDIGAVD
jgi:hypothetical protein